MNFRQYENKSSLKKRYSRYVQGGNSDALSNKIGWWERRDLNTSQFDDIIIF